MKNDMDHEILKLVIFDQRETIRTFDIVERGYNFGPNANYVVIGLADVILQNM